MARLEDSSTLKKLGIDIIPATKNIAKPFCFGSDKKNNTLVFGAKIYEFRDEFTDFRSTIICKTESSLKTYLKQVYNIDYLMSRSYKNFKEWYEKMSDKKLTLDQEKLISKKFKH